VSLTVGTAIETATIDMLENPSYQQGAQAFARKYEGFVPGEQVGALVDRLEGLITY
jgi:hypothetical protein